MTAQARKPREAYRVLLDRDANLRRWHQNNAKGSVIVADVYLRRLGSFCRQNGVSPGEYAKLPKRKMEEMAFDFVQELEGKINPLSGRKYRAELCGLEPQGDSVLGEVEQEGFRHADQDSQFLEEAYA